jgi:hypothetical protein
MGNLVIPAMTCCAALLRVRTGKRAGWKSNRNDEYQKSGGDQARTLARIDAVTHGQFNTARRHDQPSTSWRERE